MNLEEQPSTTTGPAERFAGDVYVDAIIAPHDGDQRMTLARVRFTPGARTAWHSHARGQYLHITQGVGRFGTRDGQIIEARAGQTVYTPLGQEHWHAAADGCFMEHLAALENADDPTRTTTWGEHISEQDYRAGIDSD